jgi:hypothetical protein
MIRETENEIVSVVFIVEPCFSDDSEFGVIERRGPLAVSMKCKKGEDKKMDSDIM